MEIVASIHFILTPSPWWTRLTNPVRRWLFVFIVLCLATANLEAQEETEWRPKQQFHINGFSYHFAPNDDVNDYLAGAGITWDFKSLSFSRLFLTEIVMAFDGDVFRDSSKELAVIAGVSWRKAVSVFELGILTGLTYKENLRRDTGLFLFPLALPFLQTNLDWGLNLRSIWIPPVRKKGDNQLIFQLLIDKRSLEILQLGKLFE